MQFFVCSHVVVHGDVPVNGTLYYIVPVFGDRGGTVVKVLCYKSAGRWFDSRWCPWSFSLT